MAPRTDPAERPALAAPVDVCLIVEGCYPYVSGGVSSWIDWLIRTQPQLSFAAVAIVAGDGPRQVRYPARDNLVGVFDLQLQMPFPRPPLVAASRPSPVAEAIAEPLIRLLNGGGLAAFEAVIRTVNAPGAPIPLARLISSDLAWHVVCRMYEAIMPHASFLQFYWAWRALLGGLFTTLKSPLPPARVYHTISTGYAGLLAARASIETGRPAIITEHGIYTNERRIDILMADWISDSVNKGVGLDDERTDLRDLWIKAFEAYALACYQSASLVTTLYSDNQRLQIALGAAPQRLKVIANGIDTARFEALPQASPTARPTMALIGRVVPIKDVKTFIAAAAVVRETIPDLEAIVMGPTEEDPDYYEECRDMVAELELGSCVVFTGGVNIVDYLPRVHVVVLTSLSEAQPLVLLEAGAAGIPCVTTNVGCCRELLDGRRDEVPSFGRGGFVTDLVAPRQIGEAVVRLLRDHDLRRRCGENLRARVGAFYQTHKAANEYRRMYEAHLSRPDRAAISGGP